jgi:hypothetical protein
LRFELGDDRREMVAEGLLGGFERPGQRKLLTLGPQAGAQFGAAGGGIGQDRMERR